MSESTSNLVAPSIQQHSPGGTAVSPSSHTTGSTSRSLPTLVPVTSFRNFTSDGQRMETGQVPGEQGSPEDNNAATQTEPISETTTTTTAAAITPAIPKETKKAKCQKLRHRKQKTKIGRKDAKVLTDSSGSESDSSDDESDSSNSSSSEEEVETKTQRSKHKSSKKTKGKKKSKSKLPESESEDEASESDEENDDSDSSSASEPSRRKKKSKKATKKSTKKSRKGQESDAENEASSPEDADGDNDLVALIKKQLKAVKKLKPKRSKSSKKSSSKRKSSKKSDSLQFKRADELWDSSIHNYKLKESAEDDDSEFAEFAFLVRRTFDWENKYRDTVVDIKSKPLRAVLQDVMKDCKSVSLEAEEPSIDPNVLFLYLEELRTHYKKTLTGKIKAASKARFSKGKGKTLKKLEQQRALLKMLVGYVDEDYADTKKTLYPLLEAGNITFDLLWALFHPNDIAVTSCYGAWDEPRCFKIEYATKCSSMMRGEWYCAEGKYLEYDGKSFGFGDFEVDIDGFKGPRKITSLSTYPLKYHKNAEEVKKQILERAQRFVDLEGMHYKFHKGLAFMKKKKQVLKININGRVMVDPSTFRRVNPNYPIAFIKPKDVDDLWSDGADCSDDESCSCGGGEDSDDEQAVGDDKFGRKDDDLDTPKYKYKWTKDDRGKPILMAVEVDEDGTPLVPEKVERLAQHPDLRNKAFTEEELLLTSPVVLGFAFSEKLWLELSISGIHEIVHNDAAFDSLVLPPDQKSIVRALVESHKSHGAKTIDDVVQGKGKGLVAVLHGPPGTGKTLTAEGISELLHCPLYMVSAGELGTDPGRLEHELQKILDIAHSWGAVLLLDEADVFLEKREVHDIHRNALVSIFLRLLEYFQGILFLTTNRVETFDDAFQSRIHVALRYGELTPRAKKTVWRMFMDLVRKVEGMEVAELSEHDYDVLARHQLNGRQIKNAVRTAQALALNEHAPLTLGHIKRVLDVAETFDRDLKGGTGYIDAMRSYT